MTVEARTAAALLIGNELLSGKTQEQNLVALARMLHALGISLERVVILPDNADSIATEIAKLASEVDAVFTSGGVGPTHDDVTLAAVAQAFGVQLSIHPVLEDLLRKSYGDACNEAHLRMALIPKGAVLVNTSDVKWPTTLMQNVFVLPGVPEIFRMRLDSVRAHLRGPEPFVTRSVFLLLEEVDLKGTLDAVVEAHPEVAIGSYPKWSVERYRTKVTFDSRSATAVDRALADFLRRVSPDAVVESA